MLASFLSRVMPALCTTTSTPPCFVFRWCAIRCGASLAVMSRTRWSPSSSRITPCSSLAAWGTSTPTTVAPSRCRTRAICSPMPRLAPVTRATLPSSGRVQSATSPGLAAPCAPIRTTWPDTYADLGESRNARRAGDRALGPVGDVHELDGAAAADLLAEAAGEALERALGDPLGAVDLLGRRADHDHPRAPVEAAQQGSEEVAERDQLVRGRQAGRVEDQALVRRVGVRLVDGGDAEDVEDADQRLGQPAPAADQDGAVTSGAPSTYRSSLVGWGRPSSLVSWLPSAEDVKPW